MSWKIHTESNAHDEVDQSDSIKNNVPNGHESQTPSEGADDTNDCRKGRDSVREKDNGDSDYNDTSEHDALETLTEDGQVLVSEQEVAVEDNGFKIVITELSANISDLQDHFLFIYGGVYILALD